MGVSTPSRGFTDKEALRVLEFIKKSGEMKKPQKPLKILAEEIMLNCFGWPIASGTKRLKKILQALEAENKIECVRSLSERITGIKLGNHADKEIASNQAEKSAENNVLPREHKILWYPKPKIPAKDPAKIIKQISDPLGISALLVGGRLSKKEIAKRGELHEDWLHISILGLLKALEELFPEIIYDAICFRSGKHDPKRGMIDLQDHWGNDVSMHLTTRQNGRIVKGYIIYDGKGAINDIEAFNSNIIRHPGQKGALLKKAIWANIRHRSTKDLIEEILDDAISVGLLPALDKEKILERFED